MSTVESWVGWIRAGVPRALPILSLAALLITVLLTSSATGLQRLVMLRSGHTGGYYGYYGTVEEVTIGDTTTGFIPQAITIDVGATVRWTNTDNNQHTTTSVAGQAESWDSSNLYYGQSFSHTFNTAGTYSYVCAIHPTLMTGSVVVLGAPNAGTSTVEANPSSVPVGSVTSTIAVTVKDSGGNRLPGVAVTLGTNRGWNIDGPLDTITGRPFTDNIGVATFAVSSNVPGTATFSATSGGVNLGNVAVAFSAEIAPTAVIWSTAQLSQARRSAVGVSVGGKALFAGGHDGSNPSAVVDIYDATAGTWTTASLSQPRYELAAASAGSKAVLAGGLASSLSNVVDIYDATGGTWSTASLSQARRALAATGTGGKAIFAGGLAASVSNVVDIYDATGGTWSTASLSEARSGLVATHVGTKALFAGGTNDRGPSARVDVYDFVAGTWSTATLSEARSGLAAVHVGTKALFAGGMTDDGASDKIDIYDSVAGTWSTASLSAPRYGLAAAGAGIYAIFAGGRSDVASSVVDIYNVATGAWHTSSLAQARSSLGATSIGTKSLFAGGRGSILATVDIAEVTSAASAISPALSSVTAMPSNLLADGTATSGVTVTVRNNRSELIPGVRVSLTSGRTNADSIAPTGPVTTTTGVATFTVSSTTAGSTTLSASAEGVSIAQTVAVTFITPGLVRPTNTSISTTPTTGVNADGQESISTAVTVRDQLGNPVTNHPVTLQSDRNVASRVVVDRIIPSGTVQGGSAPAGPPPAIVSGSLPLGPKQAEPEPAAGSGLGQTALPPTGGPDAYGYRYRDSTSTGGPVWNWIEGTTPLPGTSGDDSYATGVGFGDTRTGTWAFPFYGENYTTFWVSTNGLIGLGGPSNSPGDYTNDSLPTTAHGPLIAAFWDDLDLRAAGASVRRLAGGTLPNRYMVLEWPESVYFGSTTRYPATQVILYEDGRIVFQYKGDTAGSAAVLDRGSATIGLQAGNGPSFLYAHNNAAVVPGKAIEFSRLGSATARTDGQGQVVFIVQSSVGGTATLTATAAQSPTSWTPVQLTTTQVTFRGFRLERGADEYSVPLGGKISPELDVRSLGGFTGIVNLTATISGVGVTAALEPQSSVELLADGMISLSLGIDTGGSTTSETAVTGDHTVAVSGAAQANANITSGFAQPLTIHVTDYTLRVNSGDLDEDVVQGNVLSVPIELCRLNGFDGLVSLTASLSPAPSAGPVLLTFAGTTTSQTTVTVDSSVGACAETNLNVRPSITAAYQSLTVNIGAAIVVGSRTLTKTGLIRVDVIPPTVVIQPGTAGFSPQVLLPPIRAGQTVRWKNSDQVTRRLVSEGNIFQSDASASSQPSSQVLTSPSSGAVGESRLVQPTALSVGSRQPGAKRAEIENQTPPAIQSAPSTGGPDAFGYQYRDNSASGGPAYNWVDGTSSMGVGADDGYATGVAFGDATTGAWSFPFYGQDYTTFWVNTNGVIGLGAASRSPWDYSNDRLPTTAHGPLIAPFWDDLNPTVTGVSVRKRLGGVAPNRYVVLHWPESSYYGSSTRYPETQAILYESGRIVFQYRHASAGGRDRGSATIGIQDGDGTHLTYSYNTAVVTDGLAIEFGTPAVGIPPGGEFLFEFTSPGVFNYADADYPNLRGSIIVLEETDVFVYGNVYATSDGDSGPPADPVAGATIRVLDPTGQEIHRVETEADGSYRAVGSVPDAISGAIAGLYVGTLEVVIPGWMPVRRQISVLAGTNQELDFILADDVPHVLRVTISNATGEPLRHPTHIIARLSSGEPGAVETEPLELGAGSLSQNAQLHVASGEWVLATHQPGFVDAAVNLGLVEANREIALVLQPNPARLRLGPFEVPTKFSYPGEIFRVAVDVSIDPGASADGVQFTARFDPDFVKVVNADLTQASRLTRGHGSGNILLNEVDHETGVIRFAVGHSFGQPALTSGKHEVAYFLLQVQPEVETNGSTELFFESVPTSPTMVTSGTTDILHATTGFTIRFASAVNLKGRIVLNRGMASPQAPQSQKVQVRLFEQTETITVPRIPLVSQEVVTGSWGDFRLTFAVPNPAQTYRVNVKTRRGVSQELSWSPSGPSTENIVVNCCFETGDLTGWDQINNGSGGIVINDGTFDPIGPDGPLPPYAGNASAVIHQGGPGRHTLYQQLTISPWLDYAIVSAMSMIRDQTSLVSQGGGGGGGQTGSISIPEMITGVAPPGSKHADPEPESGTPTSVVAAPPTGGPDAFGYEYRDNSVTGSPVWNWIEGTSSLNVGSDDGYAADVAFGDESTGTWTFPFYGQRYTSFWVNTNGVIGLGAASSAPWDYSNDRLPTTAHGPLIAPFWDDLNPAIARVSIRKLAGGVAPNRYVVLEWPESSYYGSSTRYPATQAILYESGRIVFQYRHASTGARDRGSATIGLQNGTGTALVYAYNTAAVTDRLAIDFATDTTPQARVEVWNTENEVLRELFRSDPGAPLLTDWREHSFDISSFVGQTIRLAVTVEGNFNPSINLPASGPNPDAGSGADEPATVNNAPSGPKQAEVGVPATVADAPPRGGPDAGGYIYRDNSVSGVPAYNWIDGTVPLEVGGYLRVEGSTTVPVPGDRVTADDGYATGVAFGEVVERREELVLNGSFETGGLSGWGQINSGAGGIVINDGTFDPIGSDGPLPPHSGNAAAVMHQDGSGRHTIYKEIVLAPTLGSATLRWADMIRDQTSMAPRAGGGQTESVPIPEMRTGVAPAGPKQVEVEAVSGTASPVVAAPPTGGPDAFGYRYRDNSVTGLPVWNWIEGTSSLNVGSDDGYAADVAFGDESTGTWSFPFYGQSYTTFWVNTNGLIGLGSGSTRMWDYSNDALPTTDHGPLIAPFWDDLDPRTTGVSIRKLAGGVAPNRYVVLEWPESTYYGSSIRYPATQAILYESGRIMFQYRHASTGARDRGSATIGLQNGIGTALVYAYNTAAVTDRLAIEVAAGTTPQVRVEIWNTENEVLRELFATDPGTTIVSDWTERSFDISSFIGQTIRVAFTQEGNVNASINLPAPPRRIEAGSIPDEPATVNNAPSGPKQAEAGVVAATVADAPPRGGPDGGGYQYRDSSTSGGPAYNWIAGTSALGVTADDGYSTGIIFGEVVDRTAELVVNGGFETGDLSGWSQVNSGAGGITVNDGSINPVGPDGPLAPFAGNGSALTSQGGLGEHTLYQEIFLAPTLTSATLSWADMIRNHAPSFADPDQEFRVEIWNTENEVLGELFSTNPGDPRLTDWTERSFDISSFIGQTIRIAFTQQRQVGSSGGGAPISIGPDGPFIVTNSPSGPKDAEPGPASGTAPLLVNAPTTGGPDTFGYQYRDNASAGGPVHTWVNGTTAINVTADDGHATGVGFGDENTGTWSFPFYGQSYATFWVSSNGLIGLGTASSQPGDYTNDRLPTTAHGPLIAPFWDDLDPRTTGVSVRRLAGGVAPNRYVVLEWPESAYYGSSIRYPATQAVLYESGRIVFQYRHATAAARDRGSATIGIQNGSGTHLTYTYNAAAVGDGMAIEFAIPAFNIYLDNVGVSGRTVDTSGVWSFPFYGENYTTFWVSSNGLIGLGAALSQPGDYTNDRLPTTAHGPLIAAFWDDLEPTVTGVSVQKLIGGVAPNRYVVLEWPESAYYGSSIRYPATQAILYESGRIVFQYRHASTGARDRGSATIGLQNGTGTALVYTYNTAAVTDGLAIEFASGFPDFNLHLDDVSVVGSTVDRSGAWSFPFYGETYTTFWVNANGLIGLGTPSGDPGDYTNDALLTTAHGPLIAPFWDDLDPSVTGVAVQTLTGGVAPNRYVVLEWPESAYYGSSIRYPATQAILYENGRIVFQYRQANSAARDRGSATIGIQQSGTGTGLPYSFNTAEIVDGLSIEYATAFPDYNFHLDNTALTVPLYLAYPTLAVGDADGDDDVDIADFQILVDTFASRSNLRADFNLDGEVNVLDFSVMLAGNFGRSGALIGSGLSLPD